MNRGKQIAGLLVSLAITFGVASLGRIFTNLSVGVWYPTLVKPDWTPSGATIGVVWAILYTLMGVAAWIVWLRSGFRIRQFPMGIYAVQLLLNAGWSVLFFGLRSPGLAFFEIGILWIAILATVVEFWGISKLAGALMAPYLIWVFFAAVLNGLIWWLN